LLQISAGIADVIGMAVRQAHVRDILGRLVPGDPRRLEGRVALQERVDENDAAADLETEAGVSEPDDLHARAAPRDFGA
jgi:hypothetical protein